MDEFLRACQSAVLDNEAKVLAAQMGVGLGADGSSLVITAAAAVAAGAVLTYALQPTLGSPQNGSGRRGCVRDTDLRDFSRFDNKPLYNWLCAFSLPLEL